MGEAAVREILPSATILRPSIVFGTEDHFFNRFAVMASISPVLPVVGAQTRFQPVFVGDVAAAIAATAAPGTEGRTYELGGPGVYTFKALMALMLRETGRKPLVASVPFPIASLIGSAGDLVAGLIPPPLTSDQVKMLRNDNVVAPGALTLADLGVEPTALEAILPTYLFRYRKGGQYAEAIARGA
jgi:NADH dehydrogenase